MEIGERLWREDNHGGLVGGGFGAGRDAAKQGQRCCHQNCRGKKSREPTHGHSSGEKSRWRQSVRGAKGYENPPSPSCHATMNGLWHLIPAGAGVNREGGPGWRCRHPPGGPKAASPASPSQRSTRKG